MLLGGEGFSTLPGSSQKMDCLIGGGRVIVAADDIGCDDWAAAAAAAASRRPSILLQWRTSSRRRLGVSDLRCLDAGRSSGRPPTPPPGRHRLLRLPGWHPFYHPSHEISNPNPIRFSWTQEIHQSRGKTRTENNRTDDINGHPSQSAAGIGFNPGGEDRSEWPIKSKSIRNSDAVKSTHRTMGSSTGDWNAISSRFPASHFRILGRPSALNPDPRPTGILKDPRPRRRSRGQ